MSIRNSTRTLSALASRRAQIGLTTFGRAGSAYRGSLATNSQVSGSRWASLARNFSARSIYDSVNFSNANIAYKLNMSDGKILFQFNLPDKSFQIESHSNKTLRDLRDQVNQQLPLK